MDELDENTLGWEPYVWRGALGGIIGNLLAVLLAAIYFLLRVGTSTLRHLVVFGGFSGLVAGTIAGLAIGLVIFEVTRKSGRQLNMLLRMFIGAICFLAYLLLTGLNSNRPYPLAFTVMYAVLVGGLAGLAARSKGNLHSTPLPESRA